MVVLEVFGKMFWWIYGCWYWGIPNTKNGWIHEIHIPKKGVPVPPPPENKHQLPNQCLDTNLGKENVTPEMPSTFG